MPLVLYFLSSLLGLSCFLLLLSLFMLSPLFYLLLLVVLPFLPLVLLLLKQFLVGDYMLIGNFFLLLMDFFYQVWNKLQIVIYSQPDGFTVRLGDMILALLIVSIIINATIRSVKA